MNLKSFKIRIYPNKEQEILINKTFGCCRKIYNLMLDERIKVYNKFKKNEITKKELYKWEYTTEKEWKNRQEYEYIKEVNSNALVQSRINLQESFKNFYRRCKDKKEKNKGYPKFKSKKNSKNSFRMIQGNSGQKSPLLKIDFDKKKLKLPKLKWVKFRDNRIIEDINIRNVTVSKSTTRKYYASIIYENKVENKVFNPLKLDLKYKGLDMAFKEFYVDENGYSPENFEKKFKKYEDKIQKLQQIQSKKYELNKKNKRDVFWSNSCKRIQDKINRYYEKIKNGRKDFIEKESRRLINENDVICVEDLDLEKMKSNKENFSKDMKTKYRFGKSINELCYGSFVKRLQDKALEEGKLVIKADKYYASSKICNKCKKKNDDLQLSELSWVCSNCGEIILRNPNAGKNLYDYGKNVVSSMVNTLKEEKSIQVDESLLSINFDK
jgi:putative transposase